MTTRQYFDQELDQLRSRVIEMGQLVDTELHQALQALETLDTDLAKEIVASDQAVNDLRFAIEDDCFKLIATQQPAASDLRTIVAVMNIIVDLEQIGDKAKDIAQAIPQVKHYQKAGQPSELKAMGELVSSMLKESLQAYAEHDPVRAKRVADRETEVDHMLEVVVNDVVERMAKAKKEKKVTASVGILGVAQQLERIGDLITNVIERVIYIATGSVEELNADQ